MLTASNKNCLIVAQCFALLFRLDVEREQRGACKCDTKEGDEHLGQLGVLTNLGVVSVLCVTSQGCQFLENTQKRGTSRSKGWDFLFFDIFTSHGHHCGNDFCLKWKQNRLENDLRKCMHEYNYFNKICYF